MTLFQWGIVSSIGSIYEFCTNTPCDSARREISSVVEQCLLIQTLLGSFRFEAINWTELELEEAHVVCGDLHGYVYLLERERRLY